MHNIDMTDLVGIDLNLLKSFDALFTARSVTRAAETLRIGQPAASAALKRLRELFDDPLFTRTADGIAPTPLAFELAKSIKSILTEIDSTLSKHRVFVPSEAQRTFRVGAADYAQMAVFLPLIPDLLAEAPLCRIVMRPTSRRKVAEELERGEIDLAVGVFPNDVVGVRRQVLFQEEFVAVFDPVACGIHGPIERKDWLALPHILMSAHGDTFGPVDEALSVSGEHRFVALTTANFLAIPFMLRGVRAVTALPLRLAMRCCPSMGMTASPMPIAIPGFEVVMAWHDRTDQDPGTIWLREKIAPANELT